MNSVVNFALGALLLVSLAHAQSTSEPAQSAAASSMVSPAERGIEPAPTQPESIKDSDSEMVADPASLLPDLPPVPRANATLIGGTVDRLDRVRDQITIRAFGGGRVRVLFDPRTKVYSEQAQGTIGELRQGQRVYLETILDGSTVFARSIRVKTVQPEGESQGAVLKYRPDRGELTIRDGISPAQVSIRVNSSTQVRQGGRTVLANAIMAGSLVAVHFNSDADGREVAREISILALPGTRYTFAGEIVHLDLRSGLLVLKSSTDQKTYEIYLAPSFAADEDLHTGVVVTADTEFENERYIARNLTIQSKGK